MVPWIVAFVSAAIAYTALSVVSANIEKKRSKEFRDQKTETPSNDAKKTEEKLLQNIEYQREKALGSLENPSDYFETLAYRAGFGDIHAMFLLGKWFRDKLSDAYLKLEAEWEKSPKEMHEKFLAYIQENEEEATNARIGVTWFMRAAAYGNEQAVELVAEHEHWDIISLFPELFFYPGSGLLVNISGEVLRTAGFFEFTENDTYSISSMNSAGVFCAETYAGYEGPDSDGYGMEEQYNFYRFDDFFHYIGSLQGYSHLDYRNNEKRFMEKWTKQKKIYQQQRESYWADSQLPEGSEQYKYLASTHSGAITRNSVLKRYNDDGKVSYTVPKTITEISARAFKGNNSLQEIIVPETVCGIEAEAFSCCKALKKLHLPDHLTVLGDALCDNSRELEEIHLPEKLTELPANMFAFNNALKQLKLPENLKKISYKSFLYCDLQELILPEGLEEISKAAFNNSGISRIQIPGNVKQISEEAFHSCDELKEVVISEGVTTIRTRAFSYCGKLKSVKLPASLKEIHSNAFDRCKNLRDITLPASLEEIGLEAFAYCDSLQEITIPESVREISYGAFIGTGLKEITIPVSVQKIGHKAFPEKIIIHGKPGTEAERYAHEKKCKFCKIK